MAVDFASIIAAGQQLVPNLREQMIQDENIKTAQVQREAMQSQTMERNQTLQRQAAFQRDLAAVAQSNDPAKIRQLMISYPEFASQIKGGFESLRADEKQRNLTQLGSVYARFQSGDKKGGLDILKKRHAADVEAGVGDEQTAQIIADLESGDPVKEQAAMAHVGMMLAAVDSDKFAENYKALNPKESQTQFQREYEYRVKTFGQAAADQWRRGQDLINVSGVGVYTPEQIFGAVPGNAPQAPTQAPAQSGGSSAPSIPATGAAIEQAALAAVPNAVVTSRQRSAAKNASVGGVKNSYHLTDQARDFVPPKGMPMKALEGKLRAALPGFDVINEGDHVHVEPSSRGGSKAQQSGGSIPRITSEAEYNKLPKGAKYQAPDGTMRVKN